VTAQRRLFDDIVEQQIDLVGARHSNADHAGIGAAPPSLSQEPNAQVQSPTLQYPNGSLKSGSGQNADYSAEF
jgi:hypothetical protein